MLSIMKKCAVFSCLGLGDGLITLVLSHNLSLNGYAVTTYHPFLNQMQSWFPSLPIIPFPETALEMTLASFDRFFIMYERSERMQAILTYCQTHYKEKTTVLNPIATAKTNYPYWEQGRFDGRVPFVENLYQFCRGVLKLSVVTKNNGIVIPEGLLSRKHKERVIIHPTSSRPGKNWSQKKFLALGKKLERKGLKPIFILTDAEKKEWAQVNTLGSADLSSLAAYVYESGHMIGNDSGIGHLASCFGLPTVTICRNKQASAFWRPSWSPAEVITPASWVPNLKGLRLRDQYWKQWISVRRVFSVFLSQLKKQLPH